MINPKLRKAYDLRGTVGETLTEEDAFGVGAAFAVLARRRRLSRIAVSRDGRTSSPALEVALLDGLLRGGCDIYYLQPGPTPLVSYAIHRLGLDGGIMITGSHNPPDQNGFKLHLGGHPLHGEGLKALWAVEPTREAQAAAVQAIDLTEDYLGALAAEVPGPVSAVWDCGNGATGGMVERLIARLPGRHEGLFTAIDGTFPNHHPDPSVPENLAALREAVRGKRELGIAFDGDGDRVGLVDGEGAIVWADQLLLLLARDVLAERPGAAIVADVKSSNTLFDGIAAAGGRPVMGASGYVLVREKMLAEGAPLAGEMSGHIFFGDRWHHADDGLYVACRALGALARAGTSLADFRRSLPETFATPELRFPCPDARKAAVLAGIAARIEGAAVDRTDGLRVTEPDGWWLLRASGTEPKLTARVEAGAPEARDRLLEQLSEHLRVFGLDLA